MILSAMLCLVLSGANAAQKDSVEYEFNPHFYINGAFGYQYTIGEGHGNAGALSSPAAQLGFGYQFTPVWGLRFAVNGWQSRAIYVPQDEVLASYYPGKNHDVQWKWYYVSPNLVATMDLVNLIGGYKHDRLVTAGILAGIGAHVYFHNDEAQQAEAVMKQSTQDFITNEMPGMTATAPEKMLELLWDGTKCSVLGKFGGYIDFRLSDNWRLGVELQADMISDKVNSKKANNPDWNINLLASAKYLFGKTKKEKPADENAADDWATAPVHDTIIVYVHDTLIVEAEPELDDYNTAIFFPISKAKENKFENIKLQEVSRLLQKYPNSHVEVTGYADKATGTKEINEKISKQRAEGVKKQLVEKFGIDADRIITNAMGDNEQPFGKDPELNRVAIVLIKK